jgi:hypothetical protein
MTSTSTRTITLVHTAVHLSQVIMGAMADILADLGIDLTDLFRDWDQDESAIKAWIQEQSLKEVVLECHRPDGTVSPIMEFPVTYYPDGIADAKFTTQRTSLARFRAKLEHVPQGTIFRLFCTFRKERTLQPGWGPGARASTEGLRSLSFGSLATGPHGSVAMRYLR